MGQLIRSKHFRSAFLVLVLIISYWQEGHAQTPADDEYRFGDISQEDLMMTRFEGDSSASALVLLDVGVIGFDYSRRKFYLEYHTQIKILNQEAFDLADVTVPYIGKGGIKGIKAATHNLKDGKIESTYLTEEHIKEEKVQDRVRVKKMSFPAVAVGSVIEYTYQQFSESPYSFLPWYFQQQYPVRKSVFWLSVPGSENLRPRVYGYHELTSYSLLEGFSPAHGLVMDSIPAFYEEPYVKKIDDHYAKVNFERISSFAPSWESLNDLVLDLRGFGTTLKKVNALKSFYPSDREWGVNEQSLQEIHTYVKDHFVWNKKNSLGLSDKPKRVWEEGSGNSGDINLMLLMFLRKAGFNVAPVFLSTRANGLIDRDLPTYAQFNNVVVLVEMDEKSLLLDATNKLRPYNILPDYCLNDSGLVVSRGMEKWVPMNLNNETSTQSVTVKLELDETGALSGSGLIRSSGASAAAIRTRLSDKSQEEIEDDFQERMTDLEIGRLEYSGLEDAYEGVKSSFDFEADDLIEQIGDRLFFSPVVIPEITNNPFKAASRKLPVDFSMPMNRRYFFSVAIPDGYEIEELPEQVKYVLPGNGGSYSYIWQKSETGFQVMVRFTINRIMFSPAEYPNIREMYNKIIAQQDSKVVLRKK